MSTKSVFTKFKKLKNIDISNVEVLKQEFENLLSLEINNVNELKEFVEKRDFISKHFVNEWCENYFLVATDVADEQKKKTNEYFDEFITPIESEYGDKLDKKFLNSPYVTELGSEFDIYIKNLKNQTELFCETNIEVRKKIDKLSSEITQIQGRLLAKWEGRDVPLPDIYPYFKSTDRDVRKRAYEAILNANLSIHEEINQRFDELIKLRIQLSKNAKMESFTKYAFKDMQRSDWDESHCFEFHNAVKEYIVPLNNKLKAQRRQALKIDKLRPYDLSVDYLGREPLYLYKKENVEEFIEGTGKIIKAIDEELYSFFTDIRESDLLDLVSRENKAPGGFMLMYPIYEKASVFYNGAGLASDLEVLLHELGHCFHYYLGKNVRPYALQDWCAEVAEAGSMSMEFIGLEHAEEYISKEDCKRIKEGRLKSVVGLLVRCSMVDEFQHWLYAYPDHSQSDRENKWIELRKDYGGDDIDMTGYLGDWAKTDWQFMHILQMPFYYIDYAISEILALSVWDKYKQDPKNGLKHYKEGCRLAASKSVPEIYEAFGTKLSFGEEVLKPLAKRLEAEIL